MFEKSKDAKAAEEQFLALFEKSESKPGEAVLKEARKSFLKGFLKAYRMVDNSVRKGFRGSIFHLKNFVVDGHNAMFYAFNHQNEKDMEQESFRLGEALGYVLGVVEFGIASEKFGKLPHPWSQGDKTHPNHEDDSKLIGQMIDSLERMADMMRKKNKKVRASFLQNRILKMKDRKLSDEQKKLIAKIASIFA